MSVCAHDPYCPGHGPEHDAGVRRHLPSVGYPRTPSPRPSIPDLKALRPELRKQARSGNPSVSGLASARLSAVQQMLDERKQEKA